MLIAKKDFIFVSNQKIDLTKTVIDSFEEQVIKHPNKIAVRFMDETITYKDINSKANQIANLLKNEKMNVEEPVAICFDKSITMIIAIIGIIKAGGYYVPLDPSLPVDRLTKIVDQVNPNFLLTDNKNESKFEKACVPSIHNLEKLDYDRYGDINVLKEYTIDNLIYTIFTSGTTGEPKGVQVEHKNVLNHLQGILHYMEVNKPLNYTLLTTIAADLSVTPIFASLTTGGSLHIIPESMITDSVMLSSYCRLHDIHCIKLVPSHMEALLHGQNTSMFIPEYIILGGEQLKWSLVDKIKETNAACKIFNHYGPTEVTVGVMANDVDKIERKGNVIPLGQPYGRSTILLLDEYMNPVKKGRVGEIYITGLGITRGYYKNDSLTASKYKQNYFQEGKNESILYKTGDLARVDDNDQLEFISRVDHQVKIRGFRVELNEIQAQIEKISSIQDSAVVSRINKNNETIIRAVIVFKNKGQENLDEVKEILSKKLPNYMLPQEYLTLDSLPLNKNGKVDRQYLTNYVISNLEITKKVKMNEVESKIYSLWKEILDVNSIPIDTSFFEIGGNSLNAVKLLGAIEETFDININISDIFEMQTIKKLAELIGKREKKNRNYLINKTNKKRLAASSQQTRLWFWDKTEMSDYLYNIPYKLKLKGKIDSRKLQDSIKVLCNKHEILRTRIFESDGTALQEVVNNLDTTPFQFVDLEKDLTNLEAILIEKSKRKFDLSKAPLFEVNLYKLGTDNYLLFLNFHHIIFDDWSFNIFIDDLFTIYNSLQTDRENKIEANNIFQYKDYTLWHKKYLQHNEAELINYWKDLLKGQLDKVKFTSHRGNSDSNFQGDFFSFILPQKQVDIINRITKETGTTKFMVLMSVFQVLLYKYTKQKDLIVGAPVAGRPNRNFENVLGFFVNTLPWRSELDDNLTYRDLLYHIQKQSISNLKNADLPFEKIVNAVREGIDQSFTPIINIMMALQNTPKYNKKHFDFIKGVPEKVNNNTSKYDLTLFFEEDEHAISGRWEYKTDIFTEDMICQLTNHFQGILTNIQNSTLDSKIGDINMLNKNEIECLLNKGSMTKIPQNVGLHNLFEDQASKTPHNIAVTFGDKNITYEELEKKSTCLSKMLKIRGIGRNDVVAIKIERSLDMIIGLMGILKAGGAYLPIDNSMPTDRIHEIIEDSKAKLLLLSGCKESDLAVTNTSILDMKQLNLDVSFELDGSKEGEVKPTDLISVYYTSGSTGKPKGVANNHRGWINRMLWMQNYHNLQPDETVLQKTTLSFDDAAVEIFWPLIVGARVALMKPEEHKDPHSIIEDAIKYNVSILHFVPSMLKPFIDLISEEETLKLKNLRAIISSGEALSSSLVKELFKKIDVRLFNSWGATEVSIDSTCYECTSQDGHKNGIVSVGKPINNNYIYVLDKKMKPVPYGVTGDLYIGGIGLANGYLHDLEKTNKSFIKNPYSIDETIYRTGDQGYLDFDGNLMFTGREDSQVKVRGMRVELGEIENSLKEFDKIKDAVVHFDRSNQKNALVGYVIANSQFENNYLYNYLSKKLPDYMIPKYIVYLNAFPINKNGKLDYQALPKPNKENILSPAGYVSPSNKTEKDISDIWEEALCIEDVGVESNFFKIGGHSLLGVKIISKINKAFETELRLRDIFETPTIRELASKIDNEIINNKEVIDKDDNDFQPLSFAQEGIWFLYQLHPENYNYHLPYSLKINGKLNIDLLIDSVTKIIKDNEILRSNFRVNNGKPYTVIKNIEKVDFEVEQFDEDCDKESFSKNKINEILFKPFNLETDMPYRFKLLKFSETEYLLLIVFHHIVIDGLSLEYFESELFENYNQLKLGNKLTYKKPFSYTEYAREQVRFTDSSIYKKQLDYWKANLSGNLMKTKFPIDDYNSIHKNHSKQLDFTFSTKSYYNMKEISKQQATSHFTTIVSALNILLHRMNRQNDVIIGTPVIDRSTKWENTIGLFLNTLPLRTYIQNDQTITDVIDNMNKVITEMFVNQDVPFEKIVEEIQPSRTISANPVFDILVNYINYDQNSNELIDLEVERKQLHETKAKFLITFYFIDKGDSLELKVVFQSNKIHTTRMLAFVEQLNTLCESLIEQQNNRIGCIRLNNISHHYNNNFNYNENLHETFLNTLKGSIEANLKSAAIEEQNRVWTYKDVLDYTNEFTKAFRELNLTEGDRIAIYGKSSFKYIASIISMLMNGYVFVPINVGTPINRVNTILDEANVKLFIDFDNLLSSTQRSKINAQYLSPDISISKESGSVNELIINPLVKNDSEAYVYFTSGSTGKPKGIIGNQKGLNHFLCWQKSEFNIKPNDRFAQFTNPAFDVYLRDVFLPLISGATLCLPNSYENVIEWLMHNKITVIHAVPSLLNRWIVFNKVKSLDVRLTFFAGEPLSYKLVEQWRNFISKESEIVNLYGPSETTLAKCFHRVRDNKERLSIVPIGEPIKNTEILIINDQNSLCAINEPGEIVIKTPYKSSGYINHPNNTFRSNPLSQEHDDLVYYTGDIGRYHPSGFIEYLGRKDFQVKLNGVRIDLNEIEYFLNQYPAIKSSVVIKVNDNDKEYLQSYVVPQENGNLDEHEIRRYLLENIPVAMVPSKTVLLNDLPISTNGKIDRKKLPQIRWDEIVSEHLDPLEETELHLARLWQKILHTKVEISKNEDFFALGGHSLLAVQLLIKINEVYNTNIKLISLFENPTIKLMGQLIKKHSLNGEDKEADNKIYRAARVPIRK
ncbi:non-ribosomal peptide synthetase [Lysinibacillus sp. Ag94]|uniref:non-ribosomal peptide synthetase n=1 Tax=Lysinibacillus sp. Ag94 TaxID=2936682 RepID=UPI00200C41D0|nr:non-ribosomal peptide synthetase [Lysinibacillus sp. Ag94]UPW84182.1 amino acid adenylation domain-containing protein [Lysinibacillus sp. Ag94]